MPMGGWQWVANHAHKQWPACAVKQATCEARSCLHKHQPPAQRNRAGTWFSQVCLLPARHTPCCPPIQQNKAACVHAAVKGIKAGVR
jgi:hypothetical protein